MSLRISDRDVSPTAWITCAGIRSLPGDLYLFEFAIAIWTTKGLRSDNNGSPIYISLCLTSLTLCRFNNWEYYFFHLLKIFWEYASRSSFSSFRKLLLCWQPFLNLFIYLQMSLMFLFLTVRYKLTNSLFQIYPLLHSGNACWLHVLYCWDYPNLFCLDPVATAICRGGTSH
jgi:hypothetical protein